MIDSNSFNQNDSSTLELAEKYRAKLTDQFVSFHRRRRIARKTAWVGSAVFLLSLASGTVWLTQWNRDAMVTTTAKEDDSPDSSLVASTSEGSAAIGAEIVPAKFKSIRFELIGDSELEEALRESGSDWYLVNVNGKTKAFQLTKNTN